MLRPSLIIEPHSGVGGLMPRPMKLRLAIARMDPAIDSVACTMMGAMQLGRMCLRMMRLSLAPMARAASMYSSFLMVERRSGRSGQRAGCWRC